MSAAPQPEVAGGPGRETYATPVTEGTAYCGSCGGASSWYITGYNPTDPSDTTPEYACTECKDVILNGAY